jgi:broad specificity phosphatase PhoE
MSTLTLIRHGQASFGKKNYDQLSDIGYKQARYLGIELRAREEPIDTVFIGSMLRHRQTAETCLEAMDLDLPLQILPDFNEFDHEHILERHEPRIRDRAWIASEIVKHAHPEEAFINIFKAAITRWASGQHDDEYDESWLKFQQRVQTGLDTAIGQLAHKQHGLVFTSGGCISVITKALLDLNDVSAFRTNWTLANCGLTRIAQTSTNRYLMSLNEHGHFSGRHYELLTYR